MLTQFSVMTCVLQWDVHHILSWNNKHFFSNLRTMLDKSTNRLWAFLYRETLNTCQHYRTCFWWFEVLDVKQILNKECIITGSLSNHYSLLSFTVFLRWNCNGSDYKHQTFMCLICTVNPLIFRNIHTSVKKKWALLSGVWFTSASCQRVTVVSQMNKLNVIADFWSVELLEKKNRGNTEIDWVQISFYTQVYKTTNVMALLTWQRNLSDSSWMILLGITLHDLFIYMTYLYT